VLRKRIIFALIYSQHVFNQSRNFRLQKVGDLNWLEKNYRFREIAFSLDELIILNANRGDKQMAQFASMISKLVNDVFVPIAAGGGIRSFADAELLFNNGADKIILNSALYETPALANDIAKVYGSQSIVAAIDYKLNDGRPQVYIHDGSQKIEEPLENYIDRISALNIGEIYLNSIDQDGTGFGYDMQTVERMAEKIRCPLIIAGGAGNESHLSEGLALQGVNAVATANLFNFVGNGLPVARKKLLASGENIANWSKQ
jgi:cyclase